MGGAPTILILFAHLAIQRSRINRAMVEAVRGLDGVLVHDLLEAYPDFYVDVERERALLRAAHLVVFQHPIYWYSTPAILKHWQDVVLTRGSAYGEGGTALRGKDFLQAVSTGALADAYRPGGVHARPIADYLAPVEQMARFCGMRPLPPLVVHGGHGLPDATIAAHAQRYRDLLQTYRPSGAEV